MPSYPPGFAALAPLASLSVAGDDVRQSHARVLQQRSSSRRPCRAAGPTYRATAGHNTAGTSENADAEQDGWHPQFRGVPATRNTKLSGSSSDPRHHQQRVPSDAIHQQAERRRREHRREEHVAVDRARRLERESVRVLEILDRERAAEREDHRIERHAQRDDVPVLGAKAQQVAPVDALAGRRDGQRASRALRAGRPPVDECARDRRWPRIRRPATAAVASPARRGRWRTTASGPQIRAQARETLRLSANNSAKLRPTNHCASATVTATIMVSAPMPNSSRPTTITGNCPAERGDHRAEQAHDAVVTSVTTRALNSGPPAGRRSAP